jgi:arabinan endo-1,5-alpha-L-arabinosidase
MLPSIRSSILGPSPKSYYRSLTATLISICLLSLSAPSTAQQNIDFPLPLTTNHFARDPSIILYNEYYYLFSTTSQLSYWRASNLSGPWRPAGSVLPRGRGSIIDKGDPRQPWAPTVIEVNNTFYCFYCVSTIDTRNSSIGVATSDSPDDGSASSWTDHGAIVNSVSGANADVYPYNDSNAIDPSVIVDPVGGNNQAWLTFGSYWSDIWQVPLSSDLLSVENAQSPNATNVAFNASFPAEEASFVSYKAPWYYLWYSKGYCCGLDINELPAAGTEYAPSISLFFVL